MNRHSGNVYCDATALNKQYISIESDIRFQNNVIFFYMKCFLMKPLHLMKSLWQKLAINGIVLTV